MDTDGDGAADDGAALGVTDAERQRLAALYVAGQSLWRVPCLTSRPGTATGASASRPDASWRRPCRPKPRDSDCVKTGSVIRCFGQTLGEIVQVTGTAFALHYSSDRVPGHATARSLDIPLSGATLPATSRASTWRSRWRAAYPQSFRRRRTSLHVRLGRQGRLRPRGAGAAIRSASRRPTTSVYYPPRCRASATTARAPITGNRARQEVPFGRTSSLGRTVGRAGRGPGRLDADVHHAYDPIGRVLYLGSGEQRDASSIGRMIATVAGRGALRLGRRRRSRHPGGSRQPVGRRSGPDGSVYIADPTTASGGWARTASSRPWPATVTGDAVGDGGPATRRSSPLDSRSGRTAASTSRISQQPHPPGGAGRHHHHRGRHRDLQGFSGDGGPATQASSAQP